jgi:hypothetical protein
MTTTTTRVVNHGKFVIEACAEARESLWYPEFQILKDGQVTVPFQTLNTDGFPSEEAALDAAVQRATQDIQDGLTSIFS